MKFKIFLASLCVIGLTTTFATAQDAQAVFAEAEATVESPFLSEDAVAAEASGEAIVWTNAAHSSSPQANVTFPVSPLADLDVSEKSVGYGCSVTITCPAGYQLSCNGNYSCSVYRNPEPCAVICDGVGTLCFPSGC